MPEDSKTKLPFFGLSFETSICIENLPNNLFQCTKFLILLFIYKVDYRLISWKIRSIEWVTEYTASVLHCRWYGELTIDCRWYGELAIDCRWYGELAIDCRWYGELTIDCRWYGELTIDCRWYGELTIDCRWYGELTIDCRWYGELTIDCRWYGELTIDCRWYGELTIDCRWYGELNIDYVIQRVQPHNWMIKKQLLFFFDLCKLSKLRSALQNKTTRRNFWLMHSYFSVRVIESFYFN